VCHNSQVLPADKLKLVPLLEEPKLILEMWNWFWYVCFLKSRIDFVSKIILL